MQGAAPPSEGAGSTGTPRTPLVTPLGQLTAEPKAGFGFLEGAERCH